MSAKKGNSPMDYALSYLTSRDRTVWEMQTHLEEKEFGESDVDQTIGRLTELGLLSDRKYAEQFIRTRLATKPVSKSHLYRQLAEHHVPSEIITEFLAKIPEENELQNAVEIAAKFYRQFQSLEPETRRMRVLSRLEARGFRFDVSQRAYEKAQANTEEE